MTQLIFMSSLCSIFLFIIFLLKGLVEENGARMSAYLLYAGIYAVVAVVLANLLPN